MQHIRRRFSQAVDFISRGVSWICSTGVFWLQTSRLIVPTGVRESCEGIRIGSESERKTPGEAGGVLEADMLLERDPCVLPNTTATMGPLLASIGGICGSGPSNLLLAVDADASDCFLPDEPSGTSREELQKVWAKHVFSEFASSMIHYYSFKIGYVVNRIR